MTHRVRVLLALLMVYLLWGSTYAAIEIMLETVPPLFGTGVRFLVAALVLYAFRLPRRDRRRFRLPAAFVRNAALTGLLTLAAARGLVSFGQQFTASGPAALLVATVPLWIVLFRALAGDRARPSALAGLVAGLAGSAMICLAPGEGSAGTVALGAVTLLAAAACEAAGAFGTARLALPEDPLAAVGIQLVTAGAALVALSAATAELDPGALGEVSAASALAVLYLAVPGGLVPYACLVWLLRNTAVSTASTYAYVNPVVAVLLAWPLLGEVPRPVVLAGGALVLVAVVTVIRAETRDGGRLRRPRRSRR